MQHTSLTGDINPILREHLFKKKIIGGYTRTADDRKKILSDYFDFLAKWFHLPGGAMVSEKEIDGTTRQMIRRYEDFLRQEMKNSAATAYFKLSCIRVFYEDYSLTNPGNDLIRDLFSDYPLPKGKTLSGRVHDAAYYLRFFRRIQGAYQIRDRLMLTLMMTMGLTASDLCLLNRDDVFFKDGHCYLRMNGRIMVSDSDFPDADQTFPGEHPELPLNHPAEMLLRPWLSVCPNGECDDSGQPLFVTKYKRRFKESGIVFIFKNHALKQHLNPADTHPAMFRQFAIRTYQDQGGGFSGLQDFFGSKLFIPKEGESELSFFTESKVIDMLTEEIEKTMNKK